MCIIYLNKLKYILILFIIPLFFVFTMPLVVHADSLSDSVNEQLEGVDLSELEKIIDEIEWLNDFNVNELIEKFTNGNFEINYSDIFNSILKVIFNNFINILPSLLIIIVLCLLTNMITLIKGERLSNEIAKIINFTTFFLVLIILIYQFNKIYINTKNTIKNLTIVMEIMSPIMLSSMIISGGTISAGVFQPAVSFLTVGISSVILNYILPIIYFIALLFIFCGFSKTIKFSKLTQFFSDVIKYVFGIITTIFTVFLTVNGLTASIFDGISIKATKYAISNSVPLIGGFVKDSFDLISAGSVIVKNIIGLTGISFVFYLIIAPIITFSVFALSLKLLGSVLYTFNEDNVSELCINLSKSINYLVVSLIVVGIMFFVTILIMMLTANYGF